MMARLAEADAPRFGHGVSQVPHTSMRERHAARMRRYRHRQRDGRMVLTIEIGVELVDLMVRTGWLEPRDCHERDEIARALTAMVADAAKIV